MPFRTDRFTTLLHFVTNAEMPSMAFRAAKATGTPSLTRYYQEAIARRLSEDLDIPLPELLDMLPEPRGKAKALLEPRNGHLTGPSQTVETVK